MLELSNREISFLILLLVFFGWSLTKAGVRSAVAGVVLALFAKPILVSLAAMALYVALCVKILSILGLWGAENLKTTLVWSATFAFAAMMELGRITEDQAYYRRAVREAVGLTVFLVFITEFFTFSLWLELLLAPLLAALGVLHAYSSVTQQDVRVHRVLTRAVTLAGLAMLAYALYQLSQNWGKFATFATFREFIIPIVLSVLFLPFLFIASAYSVYERVFIRIGLFVTDTELLDYAKAQAILAFRWDTEFLRRWAREVGLRGLVSRDDVRRSIIHIQAVKKREKSPPEVIEADGWSPYKAMKFLEEFGLKPGDYHRSHTEWLASSPYLQISDDVMPNYLAYYVRGDEIAAKLVELVLHVNSIQSAQASDEAFLVAANILASKAAGAEIERELLLSTEWRGAVSGKAASIGQDQWASGIAGGYTRRLVVANNESLLDV